VDPLVAAEDLAAYLQRDLDRSSAELAVAGASGIVRGFCRWDIAYTAQTFVVDAPGGRLLMLPTLNLATVEEVRLYGDPLDPDEYTWSAHGMIRRPAGWPRGLRCVEVDCHHGYEPIPDAVRLIALEHSARHYDNPQRLASKSVGGVSQTYDLTELERAQLGPYALP
jgi:hypothetical protein